MAKRRGDYLVSKQIYGTKEGLPELLIRYIFVTFIGSIIFISIGALMNVLTTLSAIMGTVLTLVFASVFLRFAIKWHSKRKLPNFLMHLSPVLLISGIALILSQYIDWLKFTVGVPELDMVILLVAFAFLFGTYFISDGIYENWLAKTVHGIFK